MPSASALAPEIDQHYARTGLGWATHAAPMLGLVMGFAAGLWNLINKFKPFWRREWDSNPRYAFTHTRVPGVRLKPLGHLSAQRRTTKCPARKAANTPIRQPHASAYRRPHRRCLLILDRPHETKQHRPSPVLRPQPTSIDPDDLENQPPIQPLATRKSKPGRPLLLPPSFHPFIDPTQPSLHRERKTPTFPSCAGLMSCI